MLINRLCRDEVKLILLVCMESLNKLVELNWVNYLPLNTFVNMISLDVQIYIISVMYRDIRWIEWLREKERGKRLRLDSLC